jgi:multidrug efflux pump subunit AcrA (membrane-fusion protein)
VWRGERIASATYRLDLAGRLVSDLIHSLPKGARRVYVNAALNLKGTVEHIPTLGTFDRMKRYGDEWEIRAATIGDLAQLSHMVIEGGSALVRAEYSPGAEVAASLPLAASIQPVKSHLLAIPNLPSLAGLVVGVGDEVAEGELIARYIDDGQLAVSQEEANAAEARIPEIERAIRLETRAHEQAVADLKARLGEARERLERTHYLVERDAVPRARLIAAEAEVRDAERALLAAETSWTSRLHQLQSQLRQANLTVARAQRNLAADVEKQWVRSPVSGVISDVRLTGVTTRGVNLEVTIVEGLLMAASPLPHPLGDAEANRP